MQYLIDYNVASWKYPIYTSDVNLQLSQVRILLQTLNTQQVSNKVNSQVQLLQKLTRYKEPGWLERLHQAVVVHHHSRARHVAPGCPGLQYRHEWKWLCRLRVCPTFQVLYPLNVVEGKVEILQLLQSTNILCRTVVTLKYFGCWGGSTLKLSAYQSLVWGCSMTRCHEHNYYTASSEA